MAFKTDFIYQAIDKLTPTLKKIGEQSEKMEKDIKQSAKRSAKSLEIISKKAEKVSESMKKIGSAMTKAVTVPVVAGFTASVLAGGKYEDALASLSAITGLQGKALDNLSNNILKTSNNFGLGAVDIAKGLELIGSKQPALLKTPDLLLEVAKASATLAKSSGQDLATSANDLLDVMNTFNLGGEKAGETINILASASKFGSAQVPFVTSAMKNAGSASKLAKVSMVELVSAIEIMSEKTGLASERIGTGLKTAFIKLEKEGPKKFRPSVVGLQKALENMNDAGLNTAKMSKLLGDEAIASFPALIANAKAFGEMTKKIQGTNVAQEQAKIRMNTFNESVKRLWHTLKNSLIRVFFIMKPILDSVVNLMARGAVVAYEFAKNNKVLAGVLIVIAGALASIGPVLLTVSGAMGAVAKVSLILAPLLAGIAGISFAPLIVPALVVAGVISGITLGVTQLWKISTGFRSFFKTMWSEFYQDILPVRIAFNNLGKAFGDLWTIGKRVFGGISEQIFGATEGVEEFSVAGATMGGALAKAFNIAMIPIVKMIELMEGGIALMDEFTGGGEVEDTKGSRREDLINMMMAKKGMSRIDALKAIKNSEQRKIEDAKKSSKPSGLDVKIGVEGQINGPDNKPVDNQKISVTTSPTGKSGAGQ